MRRAREKADISLAKPLTPCHAQQVERVWRGGQAQSDLGLGVWVSPGP